MVAVDNRSAMAWRMEPTASGKMLSFSVSTRNAATNDVSCWISIIDKTALRILLRKAILIGR